ncbi:MAG: roadblock/LC7 domain-containing protein [Acidimicrobiia bacterium]|nr:roadblock/LC7 domain-containing protein [Acidimicrobiia bacterium]
MGEATTVRDLNWLINGFTDRVPGASNAVVVSTDGLVVAMSDHLDRAHADQLAAITAGLSSLTKGAATCFQAGEVRQLIVEMSAGYLFVTTVSEGSCFAVFATPDCDIGLVGYEMGLLVERLGAVLTPTLRAALQASLPR